MIHLAVSTQYRRVTDRQTDGQMDRHLATTQSALCIRIARKNPVYSDAL